MANKKKIAIGTLSVLTAVALVLGGTFAWQSISQTALNEKEATINPGGRLHDDFNGTNKDVYVENFADDDIFARVRLDEYMEIVMNKGTDAEKTEVVTTGADKEDVTTYITHKFDAENATDDWWNWTTGGSTVYMPTFNKNKDSLVADINGTFAKDYADYVEYEKEESKEATAIYDSDSNAVDEVGIDFDNLDEYINDGNIKTVAENHIATETGTATLISMEEWLQLAEDGEEIDNYWVYDTDGWVYWSSPIKAGTATGLLLDGISLAQVMDDSYYYAINVVGQFITADDLGKDDNTGFYADGETVTADALTLLGSIGVKVGDTTADDDTDNTEPQDAEVQIALYSADGTKVAGHGVGSTLAANSTYDIVATVSTQSGNFVVSDSRNADNVDDKIQVEECTIETVAYDSANNYINANGQLVTGSEDTFDYSEVQNDVYKSLHLKATVSGITVNEKTEYKDAGTEYALYPTGKEVFSWKDKKANFNVNPIAKSRGGIKVLDGNGNDITTTGNLTFTVEGATSSDTKLTLVDGSVVFTVGDDETSDKIYLVASNKNGKARGFLWIIYSGTLVIGDTTLTPYPMKDMQTIDISKTNGVELTCYDFWGNKVETEDVVYNIKEYVLERFPGAYVENGKLFVSEIKVNYFMLQAKYDSALWTIDYNFSVNLVD